MISRCIIPEQYFHFRQHLRKTTKLVVRFSCYMTKKNDRKTVYVLQLAACLGIYNRFIVGPETNPEQRYHTY